MLPYRCYDIRRELVYKPSIINWFSSAAAIYEIKFKDKRFNNALV